MPNPRVFRRLSPGSSMGKTTAALALAILFALTIVTTDAAQAQTFQVIHSFSGPDGAQPTAGLTIDRGGKLYGTVKTGHSGSNWGGAFLLRRAGTGWIFATLYIFDGTLTDRVVIGPDGSLYGTSPNNLVNLPYGYVYNLRPRLNICEVVFCPWNYTTVWGFTGGADGGTPRYGDLIFDTSGNMYGTASVGGTGNNGVVYELTHSGGSWSQQTLHAFTSNPDGATPFSGVVFDNAGNLYGTTTTGGASGNGAVFELSPSGSGWTEQVIYSFQGGSDGSFPTAGLIVDQAGNVYGSTASGGTGGGGTIFELSPSGGGWSHTVLYNFTGAARCGPWATLALNGGNLYGTTLCDGANGDGNVFELASSGGGWSYSSLHDFTGGDDGKNPYSNVVFDGSGNLYGTASVAGAHLVGTVWEITP